MQGRSCQKSSYRGDGIKPLDEWRGGDIGVGSRGSQGWSGSSPLAKADIISTSWRLCFVTDPCICPMGDLAAPPSLSKTLFPGAKSLGVVLVLVDLELGS